MAGLSYNHSAADSACNDTTAAMAGQGIPLHVLRPYARVISGGNGGAPATSTGAAHEQFSLSALQQQQQRNRAAALNRQRVAATDPRMRVGAAADGTLAHHASGNKGTMAGSNMAHAPAGPEDEVTETVVVAPHTSHAPVTLTLARSVRRSLSSGDMLLATAGSDAMALGNLTGGLSIAPSRVGSLDWLADLLTQTGGTVGPSTAATATATIGVATHGMGSQQGLQEAGMGVKAGGVAAGGSVVRRASATGA